MDPSIGDIIYTTVCIYSTWYTRDMCAYTVPGKHVCIYSTLYTQVGSIVCMYMCVSLPNSALRDLRSYQELARFSEAHSDDITQVRIYVLQWELQGW